MRRCALPLLLSAAARPAAAAGSTELTDAHAVKKRFSKKELKQTTVVGYLPSAQDVASFHAAAGKLGTTNGGVPWYHVANRGALDTLGLVGKQAVVALHRPWAPSKQFKVTYRGNVSSDAFSNWVWENAQPPASYVGTGFADLAEGVAERQKKPILRLFLNSQIIDPEAKKPEDWDQPEVIADPKADKPDDWEDDEDGPWAPPQIPNPEFKGEWKAQKISTLILDPTDQKPDDWEQPEKIPDPSSSLPDDWDAEEDGEWSAEIIPNPGFKGEWVQRKVPKEDEVKKLQAIAKPALEKYGKKLVVTIEDAWFRGAKTGAYSFAEENYTSQHAITLEEPKYSYDLKAFKGKTAWNQYKYNCRDGLTDCTASDLTEWVGEFFGKKLVDIGKAQRMKRKGDRLKREEEEKKKKAEEKKSEEKGTEL